MNEFTAKVKPMFAAVGEVRRAVVVFAQSAGFGGETLNDIETAVGEALANAAEHGSAGEADITVSAVMEGDDLVIRVQDRGTGFNHRNASGLLTPPPLAPRGYGIFLMKTLMDSVEYADDGRALTLRKTLPEAAEAQERA